MEELILSSSVPPPISIGEEFVTWAEKYWHLSDAYNIMFNEVRGGEHIGYEELRKYLIEGVDSIIQKRING